MKYREFTERDNSQQAVPRTREIAVFLCLKYGMNPHSGPVAMAGSDGKYNTPRGNTRRRLVAVVTLPATFFGGLIRDRNSKEVIMTSQSRRDHSNPMIETLQLSTINPAEQGGEVRS